MRFMLFMLHCLSYMALLLSYRAYLVTEWGYYGFSWNLNSMKLIESFLLLSFFSWLLPSRFRKPSDFFVHLLFLLPILPMLVLFAVLDASRTFLYASMFALMLILQLRHIKLPFLQLPRLPFDKWFWVILSIGYGVIFSLAVATGGAFNFDLSQVYQYRLQSRTLLPTIYKYLAPWTGVVFFPFALVFAWRTRRIIGALLAVAGSILLFGLTSHKIYLLYPFAVAGLLIVLRLRLSTFWITFSYLLVIVLSVFDYYVGIFGEWLASLLLRRLIFVPAFLNYLYYEFFSDQGFVYWSYSKITLGLLPYPFDLPISRLVGIFYFGDISSAINSNTGWLGSGYANAGVAGMIMYALIIGLLLSFIDSLRKVHDSLTLASTLFPLFFVLFTSSDLPTVLLTHGGLLALSILVFF